ncbi:MAG: hypothetical protein WCF95_01300 [bacterium]
MRPQSAYNNRLPNVTPGEKIISALTYLTTGIVGFIWIIISHVSGSKIKPFLRFHIFQSIFLSILFYIFNLILTILIGIVVKIPLIGSLIYSVYFYIFDLKLVFGYSIVDALAFAIILYLVLSALTGREGKLPWVSDIVKGML